MKQKSHALLRQHGTTAEPDSENTLCKLKGVPKFKGTAGEMAKCCCSQWKKYPPSDDCCGVGAEQCNLESTMKLSH